MDTRDTAGVGLNVLGSTHKLSSVQFVGNSLGILQDIQEPVSQPLKTGPLGVIPLPLPPPLPS